MPPARRRDGGDDDASSSGPARPRIVVRMRQPASGRSSGAQTAESSNRSSPAPGAADDVDEEEPLYDEDDVLSSGESRSPSPSYIRRYGKKGGGTSARDAMQVDDDGEEEDVGRFDGVAKDFTGMHLKPDHASRPLWINPEDGHIILEGFSPIAEQAQDFLVAIAEPVSRPSFIHEYKLTPYSLYAAVSVGLNPNDIIEVLNRLSKCPVPKDIHEFIRGYTAHFGKIKLVLKQNRYFIESAHPDVLRTLLNDKVIGDARVRDGGASQGNGRMAVLGRDQAPTRGDLVIPGTKAARTAGQPGQPAADAAPADASSADLFASIIGGNEPDDGADDDEDTVHSFEILEEHIEKVKQRCNEIGYPLLEEYDFRNDHVNADLDIDLKPITHIRPYQEKSLSKMFGNGRARSGIIVLPCGAGKTLVGITAACTIKKSCLVLCTSTVSVMQWRQQFLQWSSIQENQISVFTAEQKAKFSGASGIVVSTYSMVANTGKRSHTAQKMMNFLESREWGFIILDEVHVVPAAMFRRVLTRIKAHSKLGLTATLVREDEKIDELNFLVGPKLYEANWMELAAKGHIATVQCAEVWCPMTPEFYREYLREKPRKKTLLHCMNPNKFQACQFLINYHEARGDKIIVFSDNVYALEAYATRLKKLYIHGSVAQTERMRILQHFQHDPAVSTIFLSKVGDTSIDLPEATCLIQISSHFGSRRQEAQRLGRILRAKRRNDEGFNAFFYSLVSHSTIEMYYSTRRQQFLVDQGYAFRVITHLEGMKEMPDLVFKTQSEQIELLQSVLIANDSAGEVGGEMPGDDYGANTGASRSGQRRLGGPPPKAIRNTGSLSALSGAQHVSYVERNLSANANPALKKSHKRLLAAKSRRA